MFKRWVTQASHFISASAWMRQPNKMSKFRMFGRKTGNSLLDAMKSGMDIKHAHIVVYENGSIALTTQLRPNHDPSRLAVIDLSEISRTNEYISSYSDRNTSDIEFQVIHDEFVKNLSARLLNQIYGDDYIAES